MVEVVTRFCQISRAGEIDSLFVGRNVNVTMQVDGMGNISQSIWEIHSAMIQQSVPSSPGPKYVSTISLFLHICELLSFLYTHLYISYFLCQHFLSINSSLVKSQSNFFSKFCTILFSQSYSIKLGYFVIGSHCSELLRDMMMEAMLEILHLFKHSFTHGFPPAIQRL